MSAVDNNSPDHPGVIAFPPFILAITAATSALIHFFVVRVPMLMNYRVALICGIVLVIIAPTLAISAMLTFKRAGTNVDPAKPALIIARRLEAGPRATVLFRHAISF